MHVASFLGIVSEWNEFTSEAYFESSIPLDIGVSALDVAIVSTDTQSVVAEGTICTDESRHFSVAVIKILKGKPVAGDWVVALASQGSINNENPAESSE